MDGRWAVNLRTRRNNDCCFRCYDHSPYHVQELSFTTTASYIAAKTFFSDQLKEDNEHYRTLNAIFSRLRNHHQNTADEAFGRRGYFLWDSFRLKYESEIQEIRSTSGYDNAERHLEHEIAGYTRTVSELESSVQEIDKLIQKTRKVIDDKIATEFQGSKLVRDEDKDEYQLVALLRKYWMNDLLNGYRVEGKSYSKLIQSLVPPDPTDMKEKDGTFMLNATPIANVIFDKTIFSEKVMRLAKDYEIWDSILDIIRKRKETGDKMRDLTRHLDRIVNEIANQRYRTALECCPSRQIDSENR